MKAFGKILVLLATIAPFPGSWITLTMLLQSMGIPSIPKFFDRASHSNLKGINIDTPGWAFVMMGLLIWCVFMYAFYLYHLNVNKSLTTRQKHKWMLTVVLGHLAMPLNFLFLIIYWWKHIWNTQPQIIELPIKGENAIA